MPFPRNESEAIEQGYKFYKEGRCRGSNAEIEWWDTPKSKLIPIDAGTMTAHWATCPKAERFRKGQTDKS